VFKERVSLQTCVDEFHYIFVHSHLHLSYIAGMLKDEGDQDLMLSSVMPFCELWLITHKIISRTQKCYRPSGFGFIVTTCTLLFPI